MTSNIRPKSIPLNIIDRKFLVPESEDLISGPYLPMTIAAVIHLRDPISIQTLQDGLVQTDKLFPQFRLCYTLDLSIPQWVLVNEEVRIEYLKSCVERLSSITIEDHLSTHIQNNFSEIGKPLRIFLFDEAICIHFFHCFGDARFLMQFASILLEVVFQPDKFSPAESWSPPPLEKLVANDFHQTIQVIGNTIKRLSKTSKKYFGRTPPETKNGKNERAIFQPTISGSNMKVAHFNVPPSKMAEIRKFIDQLPFSTKISLNTFWQIYFGFRMVELGWIEWPIELTTLVDLRRYYSPTSTFFPGNHISNIRIVINESTFENALMDFQTQLTEQINNGYPLSDIVMNWILALAGDNTFRKVNRDWYLHKSPKESQFFTLTNIGKLDDQFRSLNDYIMPDIRLVTPIMGAAPLVIAFSSLKDIGHFCVTYKPDFLSKEEIDKLFTLKSPNYFSVRAENYVQM
jgi:hypothetical protein